MATIHDVRLGELQEKLKEEIKKIKEVAMPDWAKFVKTGTSKERRPVQEDWWYIRAASILKQVYVKGPIGVNKLRSHYGSKKNRGDLPEKFYKASGKIIRVILQQLESAGLIEKQSKGIHRGRILTAKGRSFLDKIASKNGNVQKVKQKDKAGKEKPSN